jgi:hypothetical protein
MTFQKKNKYCWEPDGKKAFDAKPLSFKLDADLKKAIKEIPDWQRRLRDVLPELVDKWRSEIGNSSPTNIPD